MEDQNVFEEIRSKAQPWKSKSENYLMLVNMGYAYDDVVKAMETLPTEQKEEISNPSTNSGGEMSTGRMLIIVFSVVVIFAKLVRFGSSGNYLFLFGIITAVLIIVGYLSGDKKSGNSGLY